MRTIPRPTFDAQQVFETCISGVTDTTLIARLKSEIITAASAAKEFNALATAGRFDLFPLRDMLGVSVTKDEMKDLYKGQFSAKYGAARDIYNRLRNSAPNKRCPLCGVGTVSTLDHYLPQSKYADITVLPENLIPACSDCNKKKLSSYPKNESEQTLHPYFDDFTKETWVQADVDRGPPPIIVFKVACPAAWGTGAKQRANKHFETFGLPALFGANAAEELITLRDHLISLDAMDVHPYLEAEAIRHSVRRNSWQSAMYRALADDAWFHSGGFRLIPDS